jgi:F-type H+-transporting ATPase subunit b
MRTRRSRYAIATIVAVLLCPAAGFAADSAEAPGSWPALIFYVINFGLFVWIVRRFGGPQIVEFFKTRARTIRDNAGRAQTALGEAQALMKRATELTAGLEDEKARLASELAEETAYQIKRLEELAREAATRIKRDGAISVVAAREAGQRRLREALAAAAARLALEIVRRDFQPADQARLLDGFVSRLGEEARR